MRRLPGHPRVPDSLFYNADQVICVGAFVGLGPTGSGRDNSASRGHDHQSFALSPEGSEVPIGEFDPGSD